MKAIIRNIPNGVTCLNLLCGCVGIILLITDGINKCSGATIAACYLVFASAAFDFLDGLVARLLHVTSPIGKDLDSLADVISFGLLPALIGFKLFVSIHAHHDTGTLVLAALFLLVPLAGAIRLARFNNDTSQSLSFKGLPIPANGLVIASIAIFILSKGHIFNLYRGWTEEHLLTSRHIPVYTGLAAVYTSKVFLAALPVVLSFLMVSPFRLMAFKLKGFTVRKYLFHLLFLGSAIIAGILLGFASAPIILLLYFLFSILHFRFNDHEVQSGN